MAINKPTNKTRSLFPQQ